MNHACEWEQCGAPATKRIELMATDVATARKTWHTIWLCDGHYPEVAELAADSQARF
jgi:hypothetical protein